MRLFEKRVDAPMTDQILSPAQPIGEVEDYFYRVKFQARGSPHIHLLVWIKDAPEFEDLQDDSVVIKFIDQYITCQMPDPNADPELHKIVSEVQVHSSNHSKSCKKGNVMCRFGFPKLPMDKTISPIQHQMTTMMMMMMTMTTTNSKVHKKTDAKAKRENERAELFGLDKTRPRTSYKR
ncbi:hypothetical protein D5F01_LYC09147 [Larimichthys crocea]|uniref:Helitron helicase-like domain-containing protein n=1 Tax=Larimichthys crocea TaxID=215358 RepID=A0A6G0IKP8_LARCR|nr:hypothetical protein D5F01_LYC09147 [Larimichthys crocea]